MRVVLLKCLRSVDYKVRLVEGRFGIGSCGNFDSFVVVDYFIIVFVVIRG